MKNAIRLTNKTARALRKRADSVRNAHFAAAGFFSAAMAFLSVRLGLKWLPAVPITVVLTVFVDYLIVMRANTKHLSMIAQAICTEAAAREIRAGTSESQRRQKAITDLINVKADAQNTKPEKKKAGAQPFFEDEEPEKDESEASGGGIANTTKIAPVKMKSQEKKPAAAEEKPAVRRRRRKDGLKLIRGEQAR